MYIIYQYRLKTLSLSIISFSTQIKKNTKLFILTKSTLYNFFYMLLDAVYVGYDSSMPFAYEVCKRSIQRYKPGLQVFPLKKDELRDNNVYKRDDTSSSSTDFTYLRFLVPFLQGFQGYSVYCDSTFLWRCSPEEIFKYIDSHKAVSVAKHDFTSCPSESKLNGQPQVWYPRKNWASLILFNCAHPDCRRLMPNDINSRSSENLLQFQWVEDDRNIGMIPIEYNYLVGGYYSEAENSDSIRAVNYTDGGPWLVNYRSLPFCSEWDSYLAWEEISQIV